MKNYDRIKENLIKVNKDLLSLKKRMSVGEYVKETYLVKQVCIASVALSCLEDGVDDYLAFEWSLDRDDRLLLLNLTGER